MSTNRTKKIEKAKSASDQVFTDILVDIKKDVEKSKAKDQWKKSIKKIIDHMIDAEAKFDKLDSVIKLSNSASSLSKDLMNIFASIKLDKESKIEFSAFVTKYKDNYQALAFEHIDEYTKFATRFESCLKSQSLFDEIKNRVTKEREHYNISDKTKKAIAEINKQYKSISIRLDELEDQMSIGDVFLFNQLKEYMSDRLSIINKLSSPEYIDNGKDLLNIIDESIDAAIANAKAQVDQYNQVIRVRNGFLEKTNQQSAAGHRYAFLSNSSNTAADSKTKAPNTKSTSVKMK